MRAGCNTCLDMTIVPDLLKRLAIAALASAAGIALLGAAAAIAWRDLNSPLTLPEPTVLFEVQGGMPLASVTRRLAERELLRTPRLLAWYARLRGDATRIHAGEYELVAGLTPVQLLDMFVAGDVYLHRFAVVEGWRYSELVAALRAHPAIESEMLDESEVMPALGKPDIHPEGQFLPDTYSFPKGTAAIALLGWAHEALLSRLDAAWSLRSPDVELANGYEALVLASIIEKETALESERALISGVFHRRLKRGMRLQTDPTVIYGLGADFDGNLTRLDLDRDTPYNTYRRDGLPPTPIALPGGPAIDAAVAPAAGETLYFVATGAPDGSHYFSATLEEHERAVSRYVESLRDR